MQSTPRLTERGPTDIGLHYHLACHGGVICTGPDCRTVRRPNQSSGIIGAVDCGAGAIERRFLDALTYMAEWARTLSYAGLD